MPDHSSSPRGARAQLKRIPGLAWAVHQVRRTYRFFSPHLWPKAVRWLVGVARQIRQRRQEPRLTVAVDVLAFWEPLTGIGWYLRQLLVALADRDDVRLRLYGLTVVRHGEIPRETAALPAGPALEHVVYDVPEELVARMRWLFPLLRKLEPLLLAADGNRVAFSPNYTLPPPFAAVRAPLVATVHDLTVRHLPWAARPGTADMAAVLDRTILEAARIITPSRAVAEELAVFGGADATRLRPVHHGLGQLADGDQPGSDGRLPEGTPPRFALHVGTIEPRKNLRTLLAAWRRLQRAGGELPLVLAGRLGWYTDELRRLIAAGEQEGWLHHFGYLERDELLALYRHAHLVALPSHYEGFGLPAAEAMAAGAPLMLSDIPVFREVAGDAAVYAPVTDDGAWSRRLAELIADDALRAELSRRGRERSRRYTWERAAEQTLEVFQEAAER